MLGAPDEEHLQRAASLGRALCTYDTDFLRLAATDTEHAGIVFGQQDTHYIGDWVNHLMLLHTVYTDDEISGKVEYL